MSDPLQQHLVVHHSGIHKCMPALRLYIKHNPVCFWRLPWGKL